MIALYIRVSTEGQEKKGFSLPIQEAKGKAFALSLKEDFIIYRDIESGATQERKGWNTLLQGIADKKFNKIWCIEVSRLSRNEIDAYLIYQIFLDNHIKLFVNNDEMKLDNPSTRLVFGIQSSVNAYERLIIKQRTSRGRTLRIDEGQYLFSIVPFGYRKNDKKVIEVNTNQSIWIKKVYQMYLDGMSKEGIAIKLNEAGIRTSRGKAFHHKQIDMILNQTLYFGKHNNTNKQQIRFEKYPIIIPESLYEKAQIEQSKRKEGLPVGMFGESDYLCSGIMKCGFCGAHYNHHLINRQYHYQYYCAKHKKDCKGERILFRLNLIDMLMTNLYVYIFSDTTNVKMMKDIKRIEIANEKNAIQEERKILQKQIDSKYLKLETIKRGIIDGAFDNDITFLDEAKHIKAAIHLQEVELEAKKKQVETKENMYNIGVETLTQIKIDTFKKYSIVEKREVLKRVLEKAEIKNDILFVSFYGFSTEYHIPIYNPPSYLAIPEKLLIRRNWTKSIRGIKPLIANFSNREIEQDIIFDYKGVDREALICSCFVISISKGFAFDFTRAREEVRNTKLKSIIDEYKATKEEVFSTIAEIERVSKKLISKPYKLSKKD